MKILIFSDSHLSLNNIIKMVELENPDIVLCGGDHSKDAEELSYLITGPKFYIVRGNCDFYDSRNDDILEFEIEKFKLLLTHGHLYNVKSTMSLLKKDAEKKAKNIVVFGHTHIPYYEVENSIHYINPGAARDGNYGILTLENGNINFKHRRID
ncbi:MAG: metallophosphoesterase [Fusobacteriaceae bacterium]|nr:metallophosphoesterase [Fusobacteriaceae bacterium]MBN2837549.1 metallophosphoesterase [Fusobacteriaceae bacterium]